LAASDHQNISDHQKEKFAVEKSSKRKKRGGTARIRFLPIGTIGTIGSASFRQVVSGR